MARTLLVAKGIATRSKDAIRLLALVTWVLPVFSPRLAKGGPCLCSMFVPVVLRQGLGLSPIPTDDEKVRLEHNKRWPPTS